MYFYCIYVALVLLPFFNVFKYCRYCNYCHYCRGPDYIGVSTPLCAAHRKFACLCAVSHPYLISLLSFSRPLPLETRDLLFLMVYALSKIPAGQEKAGGHGRPRWQQRRRRAAAS